LEEQEFGRSGFVDEKTAVEVGKLLGAHLIAFIEEVEILRRVGSFTRRLRRGYSLQERLPSPCKKIPKSTIEFGCF
jgi:hypothetical protein